MRPPPLRIGVVGWGHAARLHRNALEMHPDFEIVAVYEPASSALRETGGLARCASIRALVKETGCDIVSVCAPPAAHAEIAAEALAAGISVLVEKPVTPEPRSYNELKALAARSTGIAYSALHAAFGREVAWAVRQLSEFHDLGALVRFNCEFTDPYVAPGGAVRPEAAVLGGPWLDSAINALSVIARITSLESWTVVSALTTRSQTALAARALLAGPNGTKGRVTTRWTQRPARKTTSALFESGLRLELDHIAQSGRLQLGALTRILPGATAKRERLLEHYLGVFDDFRTHLLTARGNLDDVEAAHRLVYGGVELVSA